MYVTLPDARQDALWKSRFAALPIKCERDANPGIDEVEEWREWSHHDTTPDQRRIEEHLDSHNLTGLSILHVGIGNSQFATRFSHRARLIVGFTISPLEAQQGERLKLPNYRPMLRNKYALDPRDQMEHFDIIVDNNPSTFGCCGFHFMNMMASFAASIRPTGVILTDRIGLGWVVSAPESSPRWSFNFEDWSAVGEVHGLRAEQATEYVYSLAAS